MRADTHTHSRFSSDAQPHSTVNALCEAAIEKGLSCLAITDHCDIDEENRHKILARDEIFAAVSAAKAKYANRLHLLFGVELGESAQFPDEAAALLAKYRYDFVLCSLHNLPNERDFYYFRYAEMSDAEIAAWFTRALDATESIVDLGNFHALGHLTYMQRYLRRDGRDIDYTPFKEKIAIIFDKLIAKGIALEVNTSTLNTVGVTMPPRELIALYRERGGTLITLGSDAHAPERLAQNFDAAAEILLECGFTEIAFPTAQGILKFPIKEV